MCHLALILLDGLRGDVRRLRFRCRSGLRLRCSGCLRLRGCLLLAADRLDLDLRQSGTESRVALVAGALLVLADANLRAALLTDDLDRDGHVLRGERRCAVTADEQHVRRERLAVLGCEPVDEQALTFADAILLATEGDDCVAHTSVLSGAENAGRCPQAEGV